MGVGGRGSRAKGEKEKKQKEKNHRRSLVKEKERKDTRQYRR